ncbi:hypothetical protein BZA05DRAFT_406054 [Tricharina praecox]|uniref:uncharacterized protein n=1 Tax=Tricharina praecox TaxID=43433 RepID=UPI002221006E|nr:uncharacterized protein BZA05DRAFT_406054 [Tricharina praecox]KAI5846983.1 hypothetical protein BZA05DRAFT_406054 [Tricharina praecox]
MRLSAAIVASGIAALVTASTPSSAAVYELNSHTLSGPALEVSPEEARLGLALALGVSRFHKLGIQGTNDKKIEVLERFGRLENRFGLSPEDVGRFMLSLDGIAMEDADGLPLGTPLMIMKNAPSTRETAQLMKKLAEEKADIAVQPLQEIASLDSSFCVATPGIRDAESLVSNYKFANYKSWQVGEENKGVTKEMTHVFNPDRDADRHFMSEYLIFKAFVEKVVPRMHEEKNTAFCHFQGLKDLIRTYGTGSTEANLALSLYHSALSRLSSPSNVKTTLLLTPGADQSTPGFEIASHFHQKRTETPLSMTSSHALAQPEPSAETISQPPTSPARGNPLTRFQRCYTSKDACSNTTNSCSSHGECKETLKGCWSCACVPTIRKSTDGGHKQVINWAGYGCQKQDVSVPFHLFFIFTVIIILVVAWSIGLLYSIGEAELPSVLSAGVAPIKRA